MRRGTLILLFCNYVTCLLGREGRCKNQNWSRDRSFSWLRHKKLKKNWDRLVKNWLPVWQKDTLGNCKINSRKSLFFSLLRLPSWGALRYLYRKNITNFHLLKTKTAHRFMILETSIPSGKNGSVSPARRISHTINISDNNLILFHFSRLLGQTTLLSTRLLRVHIRGT